MSFSLATWNINSVRLRIGLIEDFLNVHKVDVLCLQEIKCQNDQFPAKAFQKMGYEHVAVHGQKGYHGVATVSKFPILESHSKDYCEMGDSRHICTVHDFGGEKIDLHNFYVPAGGDEADPKTNPKFDHKLKFLDEMRALKSVTSEKNAVLVGDLNIAPLENDVWSHKQLLKVVSHTPIETEILTEILNDGDWRDLIRQHIPAEEKLFTWWSYRSRDWKVNDRGRRLDHIWAAPGIAKSLQKIEVIREARDWVKPSDHVPVIARFKF
ncbi:MAG: exodeoxyribonuclease III [Rhizobiaceae bacterium]